MNDYDELDEVPEAFDNLLALRRHFCLIATSFPGQELHVFPAPSHLKAQLLQGKVFPFVREANPDELAVYAKAHLPDGWGTW